MLRRGLKSNSPRPAECSVSLEVRKPLPGEKQRPAGNNSQTTTNGYSHSTDDWRREALTIIEVLANTGMPFHCGDLLTLVGIPAKPQQVGYVMAYTAGKQLIHAVGATVVDGRLVRLWRGVG
jgi:hypothetical protein